MSGKGAFYLLSIPIPGSKCAIASRVLRFVLLVRVPILMTFQITSEFDIVIFFFIIIIFFFQLRLRLPCVRVLRLGKKTLPRSNNYGRQRTLQRTHADVSFRGRGVFFLLLEGTTHRNQGKERKRGKGKRGEGQI